MRGALNLAFTENGLVFKFLDKHRGINALDWLRIEICKDSSDGGNGIGANRNVEPRAIDEKLQKSEAGQEPSKSLRQSRESVHFEFRKSKAIGLACLKVRRFEIE